MNRKEETSTREELANFISHLTGALMSALALALMVRYSLLHGQTIQLVSTIVYGVSLIVLYGSSSTAHYLPPGKSKDLFFNIDRIAIYVLIAGTYTPLALITLAGPTGWIIFGIEWGIALSGSLFILVRPGNPSSGVNGFYVFSYVFMGWLILLAIVPLTTTLPLMGVLWIIWGGVCYSLGILFYKVWRFPYHHLVWHLLVMAGSICHFFAIFYYVIRS